MTSRYTDADREQVRAARANGATLEDAAALVGCSVDTARRWCAGITVRTDVTEKQRDAAAVARDARRAANLERRAALSDDLLGHLSPTALALLLDRLEEQADLRPLIDEAEHRLEEAILGLEALGIPDDPADPTTPEERKALADMRKAARERVLDARLVVQARRDARIPVRDLVGVLTRAIADHLTLEGEAADLAAASVPAIVFTAPTPDRRRPVVVQLNDDGTIPDDIDLADLADA